MPQLRIRKLQASVIILTGGAGFVTLIIQLYYSSFSKPNKADVQDFAGRSGLNSPKILQKIILMHSFPSYYELKSGVHYFSSCNSSCVLTLDFNQLAAIDVVVVFSHRHLASSTSLIQRSSSDQIWIYFAVESPLHSDNDLFAKPEWHNCFNWTMTYRRDSDIYFGYGDFLKPSVVLPKRDFSAIVTGKSKMVAWFVSNCQTQSKRGDIAAALGEYIQVDMYGRCGTLSCAPSSITKCYNMLAKDYFFYLSFENSLCKDYVTEKLYNIMKRVDIIPVVYGGANYSALLPSNSFIDVQQFPTIKLLADFLKRVASDKNLYQSYLSWKNEWQVLEPVPFSFCDLCWRANHPEKFRKVYRNVDEWWRSDTCWEPKPVIKS